MNAFTMLPLLALTLLASAQTQHLRVTKIRFFAVPGTRMKGGRFTGSNTGPTNDFETLAEIKEEPKAGAWNEIELKDRPIFRFLKYEGTWNTSGVVGEIEFWSGNVKLRGNPFSTVPTAGKEAQAAFDGDPTTLFSGKEANGQYVGIDLGTAAQVVQPMLSVKPGSYPGAIRVTATTATPGALLRYDLGGQTPWEGGGDVYKDGIDVPKNAVLVVRAFRSDLAPSLPTVAPYRIGEKTDTKTVRTFHIGNSLTDTVVPWMEPMAAAGGHALEFHRFTIPGAPTEWLWDHPASGFGDSRYLDAFAAFAPLDDIFTQPFAGHGRDIANEADYSGRFFEAARQHSLNVRPWLYVQWPTAKLDDRWSKGEGDVATLPGIHRPSKSFAEAVENHRLYTEVVRTKINATFKGRRVGIVPAGPALARLKTLIDAGKLPGMTDLFKDCFADDLHLNPKGAYLVSLVHYACVYGESPVGRFGPLNSGLTPEQAKIFQTLAWEAAQAEATALKEKAMKTRNAAVLLPVLGLSAFACVRASTPEPVQATAITVDATVRHQTIEGFGTCLISWEPEMAAWYQKPEVVRMFAQDMGLNILRCNLWGDGTIDPKADPSAISHADPAFAKSDPRTPVFLRFAQAVRKINPELKVIGTVWSPPVWMKENGKIVDTGAGAISGANYTLEGKGESFNRVKPAMYPHFAKWLTEMVRHYEKNGVPVYAVSAANEPQFTQSFESCVWTATDLAKITGMTGQALRAAGLSRVKLFGPETMTGFNWEGGPNRRYVQAFRDDPAAWSALGFYATHGYTDGVSPDVSSNSSAQFWSIVEKDNKPYWVTEGGTGGHAWPDPVREKGVGIAIHNALVAGNASAFVPWQFAEKAPSEHALTVMDRLDKKGQVVRQYARFIPAGSVRIDATPGYGDLNASAFMRGKDVTIVLLNTKPTSRRVALSLKGLSSVASLNAIRTSATEDGAKLPPVRVSNGRASLDVPADSVVTLTTLDVPATDAQLGAVGTAR